MESKRLSAGEAVKAGEAARAAGCLYSFARRWQRDVAEGAFTLGREKGCADASALLEKLQIE
jgi:hypothetical protein